MASVSPTSTSPAVSPNTSTARATTSTEVTAAPTTATEQIKAQPQSVPVEPVKVYTEVQCLPEQYFSGLMFKDDKTGTDKLKDLLIGLKTMIVSTNTRTPE